MLEWVPCPPPKIAAELTKRGAILGLVGRDVGRLLQALCSSIVPAAVFHFDNHKTFFYFAPLSLVPLYKMRLRKHARGC